MSKRRGLLAYVAMTVACAETGANATPCGYARPAAGGDSHSATLSDPAGAKLLPKWWGGASKKLRHIGVYGTYRGHLLQWVILYGRFRLQPVLCSDDQQGIVVLPRR